MSVHITESETIWTLCGLRFAIDPSAHFAVGREYLDRKGLDEAGGTICEKCRSEYEEGLGVIRAGSILRCVVEGGAVRRDLVEKALATFPVYDPRSSPAAVQSTDDGSKPR